MKSILRFSTVLASLILCCVCPQSWAAHPVAPSGTGGAVASAAPAATASGIEMLEAGGNAVDAAVATALALAVVHPTAGNLGGGGFAVIRVDGEIQTLDFREVAPSAAQADMYLDAKGEAIPDRSLIGPLATGVPGSPHGYFELHRKYGKLPWPRVVQPALRLAREGFVVTPRLAVSLEKSRDLLGTFEETARVWLPGGEPPAEGSIVRLPALARTLQTYSESGPKAVMEGSVAKAVVVASDRHGGVLSLADLEDYRPVWRDPVRFKAFGWEVASMPLPSSGGIILAQTVGLLERLDWASLPRFGADRAHMLAEAWRRAYADRFLLGDPSTTEAAVEDLLSPVWLDRRAASIDAGRATPSHEILPWPGPAAESDQTTHLSVVDREGNAVALTTTLNGRYGCGLLVPEAGFLLNNEMDDFAAQPGKPNQFGLVQGKANAVGPGKRMLSSMAPTVAWREGAVMAFGAPGGSRIPTGTAQVFLNLVVDGDHLQAAVDRPRVHHQWRPDAIWAEVDALAPETRQELVSRGHEIRKSKGVGLVQIARRTADGRCQAVGDPRGPGSAAIVGSVGSDLEGAAGDSTFSGR
ncbi:MAG: gamma-glutamyltransferase, partial [Acidobacteriota bacterium]